MCSPIQVSHKLAIIGLIAESTLKLTNNTRSNIFGNPILEMKVVTYSALICKHYLSILKAYLIVCNL